MRTAESMFKDYKRFMEEGMFEDGRPFETLREREKRCSVKQAKT